MSTFEPRAGSLTDRALSHLRSLPHGAELTSSALAEALNADPRTMRTTLDFARSKGGIFARAKDPHRTAALFWSLVDHAKTPRPAPRELVAELSAGAQALVAAGATLEQAVEAPARRQRQETAAPDQAPVKEPSPRAERAPAAAPAPDIKDGLRIALWSDGTLQIQRNTVGGAADLVLFSRAETQQIVAYLDQVLLERERAA